MKKIKKEKLLMLVKGFEQVNEKIEKNSQVIDYDTLSRCQEQAIDLGNYIEFAYRESDRVSIIHALEEYCEYLYQLSQHQIDTNNREILKKVRKLLIVIQSDIHYKLPKDKKEIVFLPYKASMWDSLESIWMVAKENESYDTYVVPIPYFDKNSDGSFGQMYYEGEQYPDYVPITSWKEYFIHERQPDIIYIHNPYDGWNYITSVHPNFYAKELKRYTKELIYVPYFILPEIEPHDLMAVEGMKNFVTTPGVIYADKVIVQSEKMKQIYVNQYLKFAKENGMQGEHIDRKYQEKKILGLGSPKIDKVLRTKKEDLVIPEEWFHIIQKPDGSWKKIIFYNTSIGALLQYNEQMLQKMEEVLKVFKDNQDEVALLWRPHPLIPNTIKSMRPVLWEKYERIMMKYRSDGWGIYDGSADLDRAVVLSDAYYGDRSSVLQLYMKTKKAIMVQTIEKDGFLFSDCVKHEEDLFFYDANLRALLKSCAKGENIEVLCRMNCEVENINFIEAMDSTIVMLDTSGKHLYTFDLDSNKLNTVDINCNNNDYFNFAGFSIYQGKVYIFPRYSKNVIIYDIQNRKTETISDLYRELEKYKECSDFFSWGIKKDTYMWLIGSTGDYIAKYEYDNNEYQLFDLENCIGDILHGIENDGALYLLNEKGHVYKWNTFDYSLEKLVDIGAEKNEFSRIFVYRDTVILLPYLGKHIVKYHISQKIYEICEDVPMDFEYRQQAGTKFANYGEDENYIYMAQQAANYMLCIRKKTGELKWEKINTLIGIPIDNGVVEEHENGLPKWLDMLVVGGIV